MINGELMVINGELMVINSHQFKLELQWFVVKTHGD